MEVFSEASFQAVLDLWGVNDDIKGYGLRRKLNDPLSNRLYKHKDQKEDYFCNFKTVSERKLNVLENAELLTDHGAQDRFEAPTGLSSQYTSQCSVVHQIQSVENNVTELNDDVPCSHLNVRRENNICDWCHCVNELRLSWCENCGHVINKDQEYFPCRELLNDGTQVLVSSHYGNTQTNSASWSYFSNTKTSSPAKLQAQCGSYQRHWKKSSYYSWMKPSSSVDLVNNKVDHLST